MSVTGCRGEYEPASFVIKALKNLKKVTIKPSDLVNADGSVKISKNNIDIKVVKCWFQGGTAGRSISQAKSPKKLVPELLVNDDSLVKVDYEKKENYLKLSFPDKQVYKWISNPQNKTSERPFNSDFPVKDSKELLPFDLPENQNKQLWLTVHIPGNVPAGDYTGHLHLMSKSEVIDNLTLTVTVLPFKLMPPYYTASIDYHGTLSSRGSISSWNKTKVQMLAELKDMVAHGLTNCQHYFPVNDKSLRDVLELRTQVGMDNTVLYLKGHGINPFETMPKALESIKSKVRHIIKIAKEYGVEEVYFYGRDEATGDTLASQRQSWQAVREAGGKIFAAGGRDNLALMGDIQDMHVSAGWPDREEVAKWHDNGGKVFCYANPQTGIENPEIYRRNFGLLMWKYDYDGVADNAYETTWGSTWNDFDHPRYRSFCMVYPTVDGVVDTIEWEGFREGIDDVRYITSLEAMIERAKRRKKENTNVNIAKATKFLARLKRSNIIETADLDDLRKTIVSYMISLSD